MNLYLWTIGWAMIGMSIGMVLQRELFGKKGKSLNDK